MIKQAVANGEAVAVTFELPASVEAMTATVCGEFNDWSPTAHPLVRAADGRLQATVELPAGRAWRFRYVLDGERWENDWAPDAYVPNDLGGDDSVVDLTAKDALAKRTPASGQAASAKKKRPAKQATVTAQDPAADSKGTVRKARNGVSAAKPAAGSKGALSPRPRSKQ